MTEDLLLSENPYSNSNSHNFKLSTLLKHVGFCRHVASITYYANKLPFEKRDNLIWFAVSPFPERPFPSSYTGEYYDFKNGYCIKF